MIEEKYLAGYVVTAETWAKIDENTVTFVIPGGDLLEEIPSYVRDPGRDPAVLIQHPSAEKAYYLTYSDLQEFETTAVIEQGSYDISFIMPVGMELIEEMPQAMKGLLQSGEVMFHKIKWAAEMANASIQDPA